MLLVDYHKAEVAEYNPVFDYGVSSDQDMYRAVTETFIYFATLFNARGAGEQLHVQPNFRAQFA